MIDEELAKLRKEHKEFLRLAKSYSYRPQLAQEFDRRATEVAERIHALMNPTEEERKAQEVEALRECIEGGSGLISRRCEPNVWVRRLN